MDRIRNKYNPEVAELRAQAVLDNVSKEDFKGWLVHPCTKALQHTLESSLDRLVLTWVKGGFSGNTVDSTAMQQASAIGQSEAIEAVMSFVEDMLEITQSEDIYEEAISDTPWK